MRFIRPIAVLGFALVTLAGAQPAFAKSQCAVEGDWRHGVGKSGGGGKPGVNNQIFRIEARNRSGDDGITARMKNESKDYTLGKDFERILHERYKRGDLKGEGVEKMSKTVIFHAADGTEIISCTFKYNLRTSRDKGAYSGVSYADIKYVGAICTMPTGGYTLGCDREYSPEKYRMKVSLTVKKK